MSRLRQRAVLQLWHSWPFLKGVPLTEEGADKVRQHHAMMLVRRVVLVHEFVLVCVLCCMRVCVRSCLGQLACLGGVRVRPSSRYRSRLDRMVRVVAFASGVKSSAHDVRCMLAIQVDRA